jgi:hypothetical protein
VSATGLAAVILAQSEAEAVTAWLSWRKSLAVDALTWADAQLLPLIAQARLEGWLADDPAGGRLLGIVRRAWTEAQIHLHRLQAVVGRLNAGGGGPVMVAGPAALHHRNAFLGSLRPISKLTLLVGRAQLSTCHRLLAEDGWTLQGALPPARALSWTDHVSLTRYGMTLRLLWRPIPVVPWRARQLEAALEQETDLTLPRSYLLLSRLADTSGVFDPVPWQVDASLLALTPSEWAACGRLAHRYTPLALPRLISLWPAGLAAPRPTALFSRAERSALRGFVRARAHLVRAVGRQR